MMFSFGLVSEDVKVSQCKTSKDQAKNNGKNNVCNGFFHD